VFSFKDQKYLITLWCFYTQKLPLFVAKKQQNNFDFDIMGGVSYAVRYE